MRTPNETVTARLGGPKPLARTTPRVLASLDFAPNRGWTQLHKAAALGHKECVEQLVKEGADLEATDVFGETALHYALRHHKPTTVRLLLAYGANPNQAMNPDENEADSYTILHFAVQQADVESTEALLDYGANFNAKDDIGATPLMLAVDTSAITTINSPEIARLLIQMGADVNAIGYFADQIKTALSLALVSEYRDKSPDKEIIALLFETGAKLPDELDSTVLQAVKVGVEG